MIILVFLILRLLELAHGADGDGAHDHADDGDDDHDLDERHAARRGGAPVSSVFLLRSMTAPPSAQLTKSFISMIGIKIENTTKATEPPISRIITGSSSVVRRPIVRSISRS